MKLLYTNPPIRSQRLGNYNYSALGNWCNGLNERNRNSPEEVLPQQLTELFKAAVTICEPSDAHLPGHCWLAFLFQIKWSSLSSIDLWHLNPTRVVLTINSNNCHPQYHSSSTFSTWSLSVTVVTDEPQGLKHSHRLIPSLIPVVPALLILPLSQNEKQQTLPQPDFFYLHPHNQGLMVTVRSPTFRSLRQRARTQTSVPSC